MMKSITSFVCLFENIFLFVSSDLSYLMFCKISNYLSEDIEIQENLIKSSDSSSITIKQKKIPFETFPSTIEDLIVNIRNHLPTFIKYKTIATVN